MPLAITTESIIGMMSGDATTNFPDGSKIKPGWNGYQFVFRIHERDGRSIIMTELVDSPIASFDEEIEKAKARILQRLKELVAG
ncbi:MAG: hypothetical protein ACR652_00590 [Methylocystis sp.]|uniref:hypothetical protein n=1 Tax=Methylocystis sp. TaxID=1911079 RepID=UPI003DA4525B